MCHRLISSPQLSPSCWRPQGSSHLRRRGRERPAAEGHQSRSRRHALDLPDLPRRVDVLQALHHPLAERDESEVPFHCRGGAVLRTHGAPGAEGAAGAPPDQPAGAPFSISPAGFFSSLTLPRTTQASGTLQESIVEPGGPDAAAAAAAAEDARVPRKSDGSVVATALLGPPSPTAPFRSPSLAAFSSWRFAPQALWFRRRTRPTARRLWSWRASTCRRSSSRGIPRSPSAEAWYPPHPSARCAILLRLELTGSGWWSGGRGGGGFSTRGGRAELTGLSRVWRESAQDWAVMNKSE